MTLWTYLIIAVTGLAGIFTIGTIRFSKTHPRRSYQLSALGLVFSTAGFLVSVANFEDVVVQFYLLTCGICFLSGVAALQALMFKKYYPSGSSWLGMIAFVLWGLRFAYNTYRLGHSIEEARAKGYMIEHLTTEQWLVAVIWAYAITLAFILWQHWRRWDLKKLGI